MAGSQPFNNPSASPALVEMWRNNLRKSRPPQPDRPVLPSVIVMTFDGAGQALTAGQAGIAEITFPCKIIGCHMYAGIYSPSLLKLVPAVISATVDLGLAIRNSWVGGSVPLYGTSPRPALASQAESDVDVSGWPVIDMQPNDLIPYALVSITGTATVVTLTLVLRRVDLTGTGVEDVFDGAGIDFTDANGDPFTVRG